MKETTLGMLLFFCTTIYWFSESRDKDILNESKGVEITNLTDSIETLNEEKEHLRKYFTVALKQNKLMLECRRCKKLTVKIRD